jgi:hypothetical protein
MPHFSDNRSWKGGVRAQEGTRKDNTKGAARLSTTETGGVNVEKIADPDVLDLSDCPVAFHGMR